MQAVETGDKLEVTNDIEVFMQESSDPIISALGLVTHYDLTSSKERA